MRTITSTLAGAVAALALAACSSSDNTTAEGPQQQSAPMVTSSAPAPNSEAALRATLADYYRTVPQRGQWDKAYDYLSPRCQREVDADTLASGMAEAYGPGSGRDFSGEPEYLITVNGDSALVVSKSYDGKGTMKPEQWTFINGAWRLDGC